MTIYNGWTQELTAEQREANRLQAQATIEVQRLVNEVRRATEQAAATIERVRGWAHDPYATLPPRGIEAAAGLLADPEAWGADAADIMVRQS